MEKRAHGRQTVYVRSVGVCPLHMVSIMTEFERMKSGALFNQTDRSLIFKMARTYCLVRRFNRTSLVNQPKRNRLLRKILGHIDGEAYYVQSPLYIDYGFNTFVGKNLLSNYNLVIMDEGEVHIGDDVMIGPNVSIITNLHPAPTERGEPLSAVHHRYRRRLRGVV